MAKTRIKELKKGQFFTLKDIQFPSEKQVYIRGAYDRSLKKYECTRFDDFCDSYYFSGTRICYDDFIF